MEPASMLYETILSQPDTIRAALHANEDRIQEAADLVVNAHRVYLTGTGTSGHAAMVGEHLLRGYGIDAFGTTNFDFVNYGRSLDSADVVIAISHRGSKTYGKAAIQRALDAGCDIIGITGQDSPMQHATVTLRTVAQERSATHTASYTASLAVLGAVTSAVAQRTGAPHHELSLALKNLPDLVQAMINRGALSQPVAQDLATVRRFVGAGAGPNAVTAREAALKLKESCYITAEGFELETLLHGGLQAIERGDVAAVITGYGPGVGRSRDALGALDRIGARLMMVADERVIADLPDGSLPLNASVIRFPAIPEALSPILAVLPFQFLAAYTSHLLGTNPDLFRADHPAYKAANESYSL